MFAQTIWLSGIFLEGLLLFRSWRARHFLKFPFFFSYIAFVLMQSLLRYLVRSVHPVWYPSVYWVTEFMGVVTGCAVVLEFYRIGLARFLGVAKLARMALFLVFLVTFIRVLLTSRQGVLGWSPVQTILLERDMRFVAIVALFLLIILVLYYAIPTGRNLRGMIVGYSLFLVVSVLNLSFFGRFGAQAQAVASFIQSLGYLLTLCVWTIFLWTSSAQSRAAGTSMDSEYPQILGLTRERLARTRAEVQSSLEIR
jgi:hypothetical protein